jgi:hypothetical protein
MASSIHPETIARFIKFRLANPQDTIAELSRKMDVPWASVSRWNESYKQGKFAHVSEPVPALGIKTTDTSVELVDQNPKTLEEVLALCKVDLKVWRVERWVANKWEVGAKQEDGSILTTPLFQIKVWFERLPGLAEADALREVLEELRRKPIKSLAKPGVVTGLSPSLLRVDDPHLLEIDLADLHFDRLAWDEESGENWDMKISSHVAVQAVRQLLALSAPFPIERILYICGNDFYTSDTPADTTTAGTPQDADGRWQKSFRNGVRLQVELINIMRSRAPVDVVVVPGNHDTTRAFYAGVVLDAMYSSSKDVRVINNAAPRKYYRWGTTLLGFSHGHSEKHGALPLIMAGEAPDDWAKTTHREFHVGHFHHKKETQFHTGQEFGPVRVRILPSLTATDGWHAAQGYVGAQKVCEAYLWSEARGYVGHFSWGPGGTRNIRVTQGSGK